MQFNLLLSRFASSISYVCGLLSFNYSIFVFLDNMAFWQMFLEQMVI